MKHLAPRDFIRAELRRLNWTQKDLAEITGLSLSTVSRIITGKQAITPKILDLFERAFGKILGEQH